MRKPKTVYLAGPITGLDYEDARNGWRASFGSMLKPHISVASPMRGKDCLKDVGILDRGNAPYYENNTLTSAAGITGRDRNDVLTSDAMVANFLGATKGSLGTAIEFGWADMGRVPVVTVIESDDLAALNPHDHLMIRHLSVYITDSLEKAAVLVNLLLTPGV